MVIRFTIEYSIDEVTLSGYSSVNPFPLLLTMVFMGNIIEVKVLDHIIIGGNKYFSFADEGLIEKYEDSFLNLRIRGVFDSGVGYRRQLHKASTLPTN